MTMNDETVTVRLSRWDAERLDNMVKNGLYTNRSDAIRAAVRRMADSLDNIPPIVSEIMDEAARKGITHERVVQACREARKEAHRVNRKRT
jgi:Arc/MetJ-type ribon-helix-helix transcriptional regulator